MSRPPDPGGAPLGISPLARPEYCPANTATLSGMSGSEGSKVVKEMRSFEQIVADEKETRNIIEIKLTRKQVEIDGEVKPAKTLSMDDVSVLIFDIIGVKPQECLGVALYTSRYDTKEVKFKPGVDTECYLTKDTPINFKDHEILVTKQTANITRVTFKNVPFNVPDEEILNLCSCYGDIGETGVTDEKTHNYKQGGDGCNQIC